MSENRLNKRIKQAARRDKRRYWAQELEKEDWAEVKCTRKGFMPRHTKGRDENGNVAPSCERTDILADFFEKVQWGSTNPSETKDAHKKVKEYSNEKLFDARADVRVGDYDMVELKKAINKMKNNKSPGPDDIRIELFKAMDLESLAMVLATINQWRKDLSLPKTLTKADVHHL